MVREDGHAGGGARQIVSAALLLAAALFILPALVVRGEPVYQREEVVQQPNGELAPPTGPSVLKYGEEN